MTYGRGYLRDRQMWLACDISPRRRGEVSDTEIKMNKELIYKTYLSCDKQGRCNACDMQISNSILSESGTLIPLLTVALLATAAVDIVALLATAVVVLTTAVVGTVATAVVHIGSTDMPPVVSSFFSLCFFFFSFSFSFCFSFLINCVDG